MKISGAIKHINAWDREVQFELTIPKELIELLSLLVGQVRPNDELKEKLDG